jgi:large subunit ribosomal protein L29
MAKVAKFREMDLSGLTNSLSDLENEYFELKFQNTLSKLENVSLIRQKRKDIARVKTLIREEADKEQAK